MPGAPDLAAYAELLYQGRCAITELPEQEARREAERKMWSVDVANGAQTEVQVPIGRWQRLAP